MNFKSDSKSYTFYAYKTAYESDSKKVKFKIKVSNMETHFWKNINQRDTEKT